MLCSRKHHNRKALFRMFTGWKSKVTSSSLSVKSAASPLFVYRLLFTAFSCIMTTSANAFTLTPPGSHDLVMDSFCIRQFNNPDYLGTQVKFDVQEFENRVNEYYRSGQYPLKDGYAPFCKHVFVPNFADVECGYTEITDSNRLMIESGYEARKENELAVLVQFISRDRLPGPIKATHLDIILYSREQIIKENEAMGTPAPATDAPWGIISVKGQLCDYELPMQPITMMRNALGKEYGGSGVPLDNQKYQDSVRFWSRHVAIK